MKSKGKKNNKNNAEIPNIYGFLCIVLVVSLVAAGGYFEFVSCLLIIPLLLCAIFVCLKSDRFLIPLDINLVGIGIMVLFYLFSAIWAVDSGMAVLGFFKFLPFLLFYYLLSINNEKKEDIIKLLPIIGVILTIFTSIMMQFEVFKQYVTVAGRLAGSFQYPNTFAAFLLICLIITIWEGSRIGIFYSLVLLFGIYESGSRSVFVLTAISLLLVTIIRKESRKITLPMIGLAVIGLIIALCKGVFSNVRIMDISLNSSTLLGRVLYNLDGLKLLIKHPFGLGYYGYYYMEQEIQTGVYSVVNVHNDILQFMLDIGIIPGLIFLGIIVKSIIKRSTSTRNRVILIMMLLHGLFDFDFQFISMMLVLCLFVCDEPEIKKEKITLFGKLTGFAIAGLALVFAVIYGGSGVIYQSGDAKTAFAWGKYNTQAQISVLNETDDIDEMRSVAEDILSRNAHVPTAYQAIAVSSYASGDIKGYIKYMKTALKLAPYNYQMHLDYIDLLSIACGQYISAGDSESANFCVNSMQEVDSMFKNTYSRTSELAWRIDDIPQLALSHEYTDLIDELEEAANE